MPCQIINSLICRCTKPRWGGWTWQSRPSIDRVSLRISLMKRRCNSSEGYTPASWLLFTRALCKPHQSMIHHLTSSVAHLLHCSVRRCKALKLHVIGLPLQELKILEMLPFDRRVVQLYGSCTKGSNILLVLELMQVTVSRCKYSVSGKEVTCVSLHDHQLE